jgi:hypothetical protein
MELDLKIYLGSCVQLYSLAETPQILPPPRIWAHIRGRHWSAKTDEISLKPPEFSVADPDPGSGAFLTPEPGSGIRQPIFF